MNSNPRCRTASVRSRNPMTRALATRVRAVHALKLVGMFAAMFTASAAPAPDFSREVRPLLEQHCFKCHGPEKQKGELRLDTKEGAFATGESGEKAIVPGRASDSRLIKLVSSKDDAERMPSKGGPVSAPKLVLLNVGFVGGEKGPKTPPAGGPAGRAKRFVT